ncbi:MAG: type IX secretion system membrane protein PorP/SprF [Bacteroidales bacterium]|nr:type IX secretion system membrane protein PorP/SprF [Bacteroidales bacterium]
MKQFLLTLSIVFISVLAVGQQDVQYTNFMFSKFNYNPGYTGMGDGICINGLARQQWMGYKGTDGEGGAPATFYFAAQSPVKLLLGGIGLAVTKDEIGFENNTSVRLAYSFHLKLGDGKLGVGLQAGFINKQIDFTKFRPTDPSDPLLQGGNESAMGFDMGFGAYYSTDKYYAGLSFTQMQNVWGAEAEFASGNDKLANPDYINHSFITGGYYFQLPMMPSIVLNPNVLVKVAGTSSAQFDINMLAWYNKQMYAGVTYRATDAVSVLAGYKVVDGFLNGLMGGLSYDITTSKMGSGTGGSFEIFIKYCFKIVIPPKHEKHGTVLYL